MIPAHKAEKQLTGRHVLILLLAFFGVLFTVNIYFAFIAVTSFRGEDVKGSYRQGLEYNQTLHARAAQEDLGWTVRANQISNDKGQQKLIVQIDDEIGTGVSSLNITGKLAHRIDTSLDKDITFINTGHGRFTAELGRSSGVYTLKAVAKRGEDIFKFQHIINIP